MGSAPTSLGLGGAGPAWLTSSSPAMCPSWWVRERLWMCFPGIQQSLWGPLPWHLLEKLQPQLGWDGIAWWLGPGQWEWDPLGSMLGSALFNLFWWSGGGRALSCPSAHWGRSGKAVLRALARLGGRARHCRGFTRAGARPCTAATTTLQLRGQWWHAALRAGSQRCPTAAPKGLQGNSVTFKQLNCSRKEGCSS